MKRKLVLLYSMLAISLVIFAIGAFAWFSVGATANANGASIQATTEGVLRIYATSAAKTTPPNSYDDYVQTINFADNGGTYDPNEDDLADPFYDPALVGAKRTNISGQGTSFYVLAGGDTPAYQPGGDSNSAMAGYVEFKLWFSAYTGNSAGGTKKVYLTGASTITSSNIRPAIRVAFLDSENTTIGVWAPNATPYVSADDPGDILYVESGNTYVGTTPFGATGQLGWTAGGTSAYDTLRIKEGAPGGVAGTNATPLIDVDLGLPHEDTQVMTVRIWIEGIDAAATDANLAALSAITLNFGVAPAADFS